MKHASHLPSDRSKCPQIPSPTFPGSLENLGLSLTIWNLNKNNGYSSCLYVLHVFFLHVFFKHVSHHVFQIPCVSPSLRQTYTEFWYVPMTKQSIEAAHVGCVEHIHLGCWVVASVLWTASQWRCQLQMPNQIWLVVLTILKNMKVNGKDYPIYYGTLKKHPNHQREMHSRK